MAAQNFQMAGPGAPSRWRKRELGDLKLPLPCVQKNVSCPTQHGVGRPREMGERLTTHIKKPLASGSSDTQVDLTLVWRFREMGVCVGGGGSWHLRAA